MPALYEHPLTVTDEHIDELGHANNLVYLEWMLEAALAHSAAQGWPQQRYFDLGSGWVVRSHQIRYTLPAMPGDAIRIRTWVAGQKRVTSLRCYEIVRQKDEATLATAATEWAYVDFKTGLPKRIPPEVAGAFVVLSDRVDLPHLISGWSKT